MNKPLIAAVLFALLPLAALADTPQQATPAELDSTPATADSQVADDVADETATTKPAKNRIAERRCVRETGSRIPARHSVRRDGGCLPVNGRSYSREELERTGETDIADALRRLDPAIR